VVLIEAAPGLPAEVRTVELSAGRRLRTLRGTLEELEALAGTTGDDYLRVFVRGQQRAGMSEQVREWFAEAVDVGVETPDHAAARPDASRRLGRSPRELFGEYLNDRDAADERVLALFSELLDAAHAPDAA
jgi:exonuclease SbcD